MTEAIQDISIVIPDDDDEEMEGAEAGENAADSAEEEPAAEAEAPGEE